MRVEPRLGNLFVLGAGEIATRGLTFVAFAYLGRVLEPAQFGLLGSALAIMMFCTLAVIQGFDVLGSRETTRHPGLTESLVRRVVSAQLWLALVLVLLVFAATWVVQLDPVLEALLRGLAIALLGVPFLLNWVFQGRNEMFWYAAPLVLRQAVFLVVALVLVRRPDDLIHLPFAEIAAIATAGLCFVTVYRRLGFRFHIDLRAGWDRELFRHGLPIGISTLIWALRMYLPVLVVLGVLGAEAAGFFESGHRIVMVFLALLGVYFTNIFPAMSATSHTSYRDFKRLIRRALRTSLGATIVLSVVAVFMAPAIIGIVFGKEYVTAQSVPTFVVLVFLTPVLALRRTGRNALIVMNQQRAELLCSAVGVGLLIALLLFLTRAIGVVGAAWAMLASEIVATTLIWWVVRARMREAVAANAS